MGDSNVEFNHNSLTARVKIQQSVDNQTWFEHIRDDVLTEYMPNNGPLSAPSAKRSTMLELQTLKCEPFYQLLFPPFYQEGSTKKGIVAGKIDQYIGPVCVAGWFCGDGSRADFTKNQGKGITLHSQGFTQAENEYLASCIQKNLGLKCAAKADGNKSGQYRIDISGTSYDQFVKMVGPYIHPNFHYRVPSGRVSNSQFGTMTEPERSSLLGSALVKDIVCTYVKT